LLRNEIKIIFIRKPQNKNIIKNKRLKPRKFILKCIPVLIAFPYFNNLLKMALMEITLFI